MRPDTHLAAAPGQQETAATAYPPLFSYVNRGQGGLQRVGLWVGGRGQWGEVLHVEDLLEEGQHGDEVVLVGVPLGEGAPQVQLARLPSVRKEGRM